MKKAILALLIVTLFWGHATAATKYWDINGTTAGAGGATPTGTWNTSIANWDLTADGTGAATTFASGTDSAVFSAGTDATGTFTVTNSALTASSVTVEEGTVLSVNTSALSTQTISINNGAKLSFITSLGLTVAAGGTLTLNGGTATIANRSTTAGSSFLTSSTSNTNMGIVLNGGGHVSADGGAGAITIYTGLISGTGPLTVDGNGATFRLTTTAATYSGDTIVNGKFQISTTANVIPNGTNMTINAGGTFDAQNSDTIASIAGAGAITGTSTLTLTGTASTTYSGVMSGSRSLAVNKSGGTGTLLLQGANSYTGTFTLTNGTVTVDTGATAKLCGSICDLVINGGTLNLNNSAQTIENLTSTAALGTINLAAGLTLTSTAVASGTYSGTIAGAGGFTKTDANNQTLSGPNSYDGVTAITGTGTISVGSATALGSTVGKTTVASGALLNFQSGTTLTVNENVDIAGTGNGVSSSGGAIFVQTANTNITFGGTMTLTADAAVGVSSAALASANFSNPTAFTFTGGTGKNLTLNGASGTGTKKISGAISLGTGSLTKLQSGTWVLSGNNTYTGATTISAGTLQLGDAGATGTLSTSSAIVDNATFTINRTNAVTQGTDFSSSAITGTGSLTQAGTGTTTLLAANSYGGTTTISAGILQLGNGGATGSLSTTGTIVDNANLTFNRNNAVAQGTDFSSSAITGTGTLTQAGTGTTTLTANTYSGNTTVSGGTLLANNTSGSATGTGNVSVGSGATLGGTGAVSGTVTVDAGGTLSPGASVESLGTGSLTFNASATTASHLKFEIGSAGAADLVNAALGALNIADSTAGASAAGTILDLSSSGFVPNGNKYTVIAYNGSWNNNKFKNDIGGYVYLAGAFPKQFLIKYQDTTPGGNFYSTETQPGSPNISGASRFVTLVAVPELGSFLTMGLVGCCAVGAVRLGKRFGFKALSL